MLFLQVSLTLSEGKQLIGMSVAQMGVVPHAFREGVIVVATSTMTVQRCDLCDGFRCFSFVGF